MAKKKFNKEERLAIIKKLSKIASERAKASWEKHRAAYRPSAEYQRAKMLIAQRNNACKELKELNSSVFLNWNYFEQIKDICPSLIIAIIMGLVTYSVVFLNLVNNSHISSAISL